MNWNFETHAYLIRDRARYINKTPFKRESLRLAKLLENVALLAREGAIMAGGPGLDERLIEVAANAVAWLEQRAADQRVQAGLEAPPHDPLGFLGGGQGGASS